MYKFYNLMSLLKEYMDLKSEQGASVEEIDEELTADIENIMTETKGMKSPDSFPYDEPEELDEIKKHMPTPKYDVCINEEDLDEDGLMDKLSGAWIGRSAGCVLGVPVEGWSKEQIEDWARKLNQYPLKDYWSEIPHDRAHYDDRVSNFLLGNIQYVGTDDDLAYTVLGLHVLEEHGFDFNWENVAQEWIDHLPLACTAENVALKNVKKGIMPPKSGMVDNPFCEWIGASIRADIWGYVTPGMPGLASEMAYRDSRISHVENGTYGEMFFSSIMSAAFVEKDVDKLIDIGLSYIPENCRLSEAITDTVKWCKRERKWKDVFYRIRSRYGKYNDVHTINNACLCILALMKGEMDFTRSIGISVMAGWDTDCNAATVGSIMGIILGLKDIPERWYKCFNGQLHTYVKGFEQISFEELVNRTYKLALRCINEKSTIVL